MIPEFTMGDRMRKAREVLGMSQADFAKHIGVGRSTVQSYESSIERPKPIVLRGWALATGVPAEWLLTGVAPQTENSPGQRAKAVGEDVARPEGFEPPTF